MRTAYALLGLAVLLAACGSPDYGPAEEYDTSAYAHRGSTVKRVDDFLEEYFESDDYLVWSPGEAVYRTCKMIGEPNEEHRARFRPVGRNEVILAKRYHRTHAAVPGDLARMRHVFVPSTVHLSPTRGRTQGGSRSFVKHARRETWLRFEILNTSEISEGAINVRWGEKIIDVPTWSLRVASE